MKRVAFFLLLLAPSASADDAACFADAEKGQLLRNEGKLTDARARFIACSQSCPGEVAKDCGRWLSEVEERMPTIVLGARDDAGHDLVDVHYILDDGKEGSTADGRPLPLDPGPHRVTFSRAGSSPVVQTIVVRVGEKDRPILATFSAPPPPAAPAQRHVPVASWILAGAGVVGLGVGSYFAARGASDYSTFHCDTGCRANDKDKVDTAFVVADIGLIGGALALAGAVVLYLTSDRPPAPNRASR